MSHRLMPSEAQKIKDDYFATEIKLPQKTYRCYEVGATFYVRKDGRPLTQEDIDLLKKLELGNVLNYFDQVGRRGLVHWWEADSSD